MGKMTRRALLVGGGVIGAGALGVGGLAGRNWLRDREPPALAPQDADRRLLWSNWSGIAHSYPAARVAYNAVIHNARIQPGDRLFGKRRFEGFGRFQRPAAGSDLRQGVPQNLGGFRRCF